MKEVPIKSTCNACGGEGCLSTGKTFELAGREHPLLTCCVACDGKGTLLNWVDVHQLAMLLNAIAAEKQPA
jgi:hypothetical protein